MSSSPASCRRSFDALLTLAFVLALSAPWIDALVRDVEARGPRRELRAAAPQPPMPSGAWAAALFPERYERHFSDTFGLRDRLLRWHSIVHVFGFGLAPSNSAMILGDDRWLFYGGENSLAVFRGAMPFSPDELSEWIAAWRRRRDFLAQRDILYVFVIAPNKESVYPERMPARFHRAGPTRLDQVVAALRVHTDVPVLDLRAALHAEKDRDEDGDFAYCELGTHWSGRGQYAAYRGIVESLRARIPMPAPKPIDRFEMSRAPGEGDSWAGRMYIGDLLTQRATICAPRDGGVEHTLSLGSGPQQLHVYEQDRRELPRGVVFHDSFGPEANALLASHFRLLACKHSPLLDVALIERVQPDVVVELFVERVLASPPVEPEQLRWSDSDRGAFESSKRTIFSLDTGSTRLRAVQATRIEPVAVARGRGLDVHVDAQSGSFEIPDFERPDEGDYVLRMDIESTATACLRVHFKTPGTASYRHGVYRLALLLPGRNEVLMRFGARESVGTKLAWLCGIHGTYRIRDLEARAVPAGD